MRYILFFSILLFFTFGCKREIVRNYYFDSGEIKNKCIYPNKKDTLNFKQIDYYPTGELYREFILKDGKIEGGYKEFYKTGIIFEKGNFIKGKLEGIFQQYDSVGEIASESYYLKGLRILYSEFFDSEDNKLTKQLFYGLEHDTVYPIGALIRIGNEIQSDLSHYAIMVVEDTILMSNQCIKLKIYTDQTPKTKFEVTFGLPDLKHGFEMIDTTYTLKQSESLVCNLKLMPGINHIFGRVLVYDADSISTSASYYVYKDIFVK
jgi:hypothetical protein